MEAVSTALLVLFVTVTASWLCVAMARRGPFLSSLRGKHVVITGGSTGIGLCLAKCCLLEGAHVTLIARTHKNLLAAKSSFLHDVGCPTDSVLIKAVDVASASEVSQAIQECFAWRPIDILVCNAGIARGGFLDEVSPDDLDAQLRVNFLGSILPVYTALPFLKQRAAQGFPTSIVFMNSLCSLYFACGGNLYMISKYAQKGLAELLRVELLPYNIKVQLVLPGYTETSMLDEVVKFGHQAPVWKKLFMFERHKAQTAEQVARVTVQAMKRGNFLTTTALEGFWLGILGRGLALEQRPLLAVVECLLSLPARLAGLVMYLMISASVRKQAL